MNIYVVFFIVLELYAFTFLKKQIVLKSPWTIIITSHTNERNCQDTMTFPSCQNCQIQDKAQDAHACQCPTNTNIRSVNMPSRSKPMCPTAMPGQRWYLTADWPPLHLSQRI